MEETHLIFEIGENKKNGVLRNIFANVLLVMDDALNSKNKDLNDNQDESINEIYQQIEAMAITPKPNATLSIAQINRQRHIDDQIKELQEKYLLKEQYMKSHKPSLRRLDNKNKFYYHSRLPKLSKNYRMNNKFRYNRW